MTSKFTLLEKGLLWTTIAVASAPGVHSTLSGQWLVGTPLACAGIFIGSKIGRFSPFVVPTAALLGALVWLNERHLAGAGVTVVATSLACAAMVAIERWRPRRYR